MIQQLSERVNGQMVNPCIDDRQTQLAYVSCVQQLEEVKRQKRCLYIRPPVSDYGTLQFEKFDEIEAIGYAYACQEIAKWKKKIELAGDEPIPETPARRPKLKRTGSCEALLQQPAREELPRHSVV